MSEPLLLGGVAYTPNVVTAWDGMRWPWPRRVSIRSRSLAESMHYDASRRTVRPWQSHRSRRSAGDSNHRPRYLSSWLMVARSSVMNRLKSCPSVTYEFAPSCR